MWQQTTVQKWISNDKHTTYCSNAYKSGDREAFDAPIAPATGRMWLDTTAIDKQTYRVILEQGVSDFRLHFFVFVYMFLLLKKGKHSQFINNCNGH
jgi:hypothetical protein